MSAFIAGAPTAISYNIVSAGNRKGIVYELVRGRNVSETITADPSLAYKMGEQTALVALKLHTAPVGDVELPRSTSIVIRMIAFDYLRGHKYEYSYVSYVHDRVLKTFG